MLPGIEQRLDLIGFGIIARSIASLVIVAGETGPSQVFQDGGAVVFLRTHVVDLERSVIEVSMHVAVLATMAGSFRDLTALFASDAHVT